MTDQIQTTSSGTTSRTGTARVGLALVALVGLGGALNAAAGLWQMVTGRFLFALGGAYPYLTLGLLPQLLQAESTDGDQIRVIDLDLWIRALAWLPQVVAGVTLTLVALTVIRLLREIGASRAFDAATIRLVRRTGVFLVVGGLLAGALDTTASFLFTYTQTGSEGWGATYHALGFTGGSWPIGQIVVGVVVLAVGIAFRDGARLQDEIDHVV